MKRKKYRKLTATEIHDIIARIDRKESRASIAKRYGVSTSTVGCYTKKNRKNRTLPPRPKTKPALTLTPSRLDESMARLDPPLPGVITALTLALDHLRERLAPGVDVTLTVNVRGNR